MATIKQRYAPDIKNYKYLIHPLKESPNITQGYLYTKEERDIHDLYFHNAIDYKASYNTPVYAAANGYAVAGYHRYTNLNEDNTPKLYKGKPFSTGLGYFVQIYHPYNICRVKGGRITQYGHLSKFTDDIYAKTTKPLTIDFKKGIVKYNKQRRKYKKSKIQIHKDLKETTKLLWRYPWIRRLYGFSYSDDINKKDSYLYTPKELVQLHKQGSKYVKWVNQDDIIGYTGSSGLIHGRLKYPENKQRPNIKNLNNWDNNHLHFQEAIRDWQKGETLDSRDPYDIYLSKEHYPKLSYNTLFIDFEKKISL